MILMFRSDIAEELGTEEIHLNCNDPSSLAAGSSAATKLSRFFDKVGNLQSCREYIGVEIMCSTLSSNDYCICWDFNAVIHR